MNAYVYKLFELEHLRISTELLSTIFDNIFKKVDLNKVMKNQLQNLSE